MITDFVDAKTLATLQDLRFIAQQIAAGGAYGLHSSRQKGAGLEFSQYRAYEPGDDPRNVDWRLYARSDRFYVRESDRESQQTVWFLLDLTESMNQDSHQINHWTKLRYSQCLTAALCYLSFQQGDRFGIIGIHENGLKLIPDGAGHRHLDRTLLALDGYSSSGSWPENLTLDVLWENLNPHSVCVVVSDFFQYRNEILSTLKRISGAGSEILALQLVTQDEIDFSYTGKLAFLDRETQTVVQVDTADARESYLREFSAYQKQLQGDVLDLGGRLETCVIEKPLDKTVRQILTRPLPSRRGRLRGAR